MTDEAAYEWRRIAIVYAMLEDEQDSNELSNFTKAGLKTFPKFASDVNWDGYSSGFRILLRQ